MSRSRFRTAGFTVALAAALAAAACSDNTVTTPTTTGATITETFTGTLTPNGAIPFPFVATVSGTITATLTTVSPDTTLPIGFALGTWNSSSNPNVCQITLSNDRAVQGTTITGQASGNGSFCARVFDAAGNVTQPESIGVTVVHP